MPRDLISEIALIEVSRAQREAWDRSDHLNHWYWLMVDGGVSEAEALSVIESVRMDETRRAA
jgi:hypothetical protein